MQDFCRAAYIAALNKLAESTTDEQLEQLWCIFSNRKAFTGAYRGHTARLAKCSRISRRYCSYR